MFLSIHKFSRVNEWQLLFPASVSALIFACTICLKLLRGLCFIRSCCFLIVTVENLLYHYKFEIVWYLSPDRHDESRLIICFITIEKVILFSDEKNATAFRIHYFFCFLSSFHMPCLYEWWINRCRREQREKAGTVSKRDEKKELERLATDIIFATDFADYTDLFTQRLRWFH